MPDDIDRCLCVDADGGVCTVGDTLTEGCVCGLRLTWVQL